MIKYYIDMLHTYFGFKLFWRLFVFKTRFKPVKTKKKENNEFQVMNWKLIHIKRRCTYSCPIQEVTNLRLP